MKDFTHNIGMIHIIGIGGIGMSGIAEVLRARGYDVQGSDMSENPNVLRLRNHGIQVFIGQRAQNLENVCLVVHSTAIKEDNPEMIAARMHRIPVINRSAMLGELMRGYLNIAISGTHGKTTTTTLMSHVLASLDPTVINGGILNAFKNNIRVGKSDWVVVEADESDGTFTRIPVTIPVVMNIDPEHMDYYKTEQNLMNHFRQFMDSMAFYGFGVMCIDDERVQTLLEEKNDTRHLTYGFSSSAQFCVENAVYKSEGSFFDIVHHDTRIAQKIFLPMPGPHNILNATAAFIVAYKLGVPVTKIVQELAEFQGVQRRFTHVGMVKENVLIVDDYAHHPAEIKAALRAAQQTAQGRVFAVFQPHRYSRFSNHFNDFVTSFEDADHILVAPVFSAGESAISGFDHKNFIDALHKKTGRNCQEVLTADLVANFIDETASSGDLVVFLGAGDITRWAHSMPDKVSDLASPRQRVMK